MRGLAALFCMMLLCSVSHAVDEDIQLLLPQDNVSSRPILEFRARNPKLGGDGQGSSPVGHAYVLLGRELDNGNTLFNEVKGFYPDKGDFFHSAYGKGVVKQTLADASQDVVFRIYITPLQETQIRRVFRTWNDKDYSVVLRNCVDFTRAVARAANLDVPFIEGDLSQEFPSIFVRLLKEKNDANTPLRAGIGPGGGASANPQVPQPPQTGGLSPAEIATKNREPRNQMMNPPRPPVMPPGPLLPPVVALPPLPPPPPPQIITPPPPPPQPTVVMPPQR
jgi:hypothetical protein